MTETINGVRRDLYGIKWQRIMRFYVDGVGFERANVMQSCSLDNPPIWTPVSISFPTVGFSSYDTEDELLLTATLEAFRQAKEVADAWSKDKGKEIKST